jgi:hypothetical protein
MTSWGLASKIISKPFTNSWRDQIKPKKPDEEKKR